MPLVEEDCTVSYKVLIIGDATVGKTAILRALQGKEFQDRTRPTVACDFIRKSLEVDGALVQLNVWDTAGQERFHSITKWHYRGVKGIVVVYDITDKNTFGHLEYWVDMVNQEVCHTNNLYETVPVVLLGNKSDLEDTRMVKTKEGQALAHKVMAFDFFETSAKTGSNVLNAFQRLAYHVTEICDPKLMKSYHPYMLRPPDILRKTGSTMRQRIPSDLFVNELSQKKNTKKKMKNSRNSEDIEMADLSRISNGKHPKDEENKKKSKQTHKPKRRKCCCRHSRKSCAKCHACCTIS